MTNNLKNKSEKKIPCINTPSFDTINRLNSVYGYDRQRMVSIVTESSKKKKNGGMD